jgi:raffinose/stachyose/melibiose transport system substrate-binding protein
MKKILLISTALLLIVGVCGFTGGKQGPAAEEMVTLQLWGWRPQDEPVWAEAQQVLQERGENIAIEYESFVATEYDAKVLVSLQGGTGPDIYLTRRLPGERTQPLLDNGYLVPLDDKIDFSNFTEATLNFIRAEGTTWGVPFANQIVGIFYNKDIYDKYGFEEPATWDELLAICKKLKGDGVTPFMIPGNAAWALAMQHAMVGVSIPGEEWIGKLIKGETNFLDPKFIDINKRLNDLKIYYQKDFVANSTAEMDAGFAMGQAAMVFYGIWAGTNWKTLNPNFNYGYFPVPPASRSIPARAYVYMDGSYGLNPASEHQEEALKVLKFTATPEYGTIFSKHTGEMTAVVGATLPQDNPILAEGYDLSTKIGAKNIYWVGSPFERSIPTVYNMLTQFMQAMYLDEMTPEQLAKEIQDGVGAWYPAFK